MEADTAKGKISCIKEGSKMRKPAIARDLERFGKASRVYFVRKVDALEAKKSAEAYGIKISLRKTELGWRIMRA